MRRRFRNGHFAQNLILVLNNNYGFHVKDEQKLYIRVYIYIYIYIYICIYINFVVITERQQFPTTTNPEAETRY
jgi:hypothetical protein